MAQALDTTTYKLARNVSRTGALKVKETQFGDEYRQIALDGINNNQESWSLNFIPCDSTTAIALTTLLENSISGTANYLSWTPPGESTTKYWTAHDVNKSYVPPNRWQVVCSLRREYPLS